MTLDEAIAHCKEVAQRLKASCDLQDHVCGDEHLQLASWLEELKALREEKAAREEKERVDSTPIARLSGYFDSKEHPRGMGSPEPDDSWCKAWELSFWVKEGSKGRSRDLCFASKSEALLWCEIHGYRVIEKDILYVMSYDAAIERLQLATVGTVP